MKALKFPSLPFKDMLTASPSNEATVDVEAYLHLYSLQLADSCPNKDDPINIDILIGSAYYFDIVSNEICRGTNGSINTVFG